MSGASLQRFCLVTLLSISVVSAYSKAAFAETSTPPAPAPDKPTDSSSKYGPTPSPPGAMVYFIDLKDGAVIQPKTVIHFGLRGMGVAPAGSDRANSGHHHLLVDTDLPPLNKPIPNDFNHLHYGAGQTEAEIELPPGDHTLQLILGDKKHIPFNPPVISEKIKVTVVDPNAPAPAHVVKRHPSPPDAKVYFVYPYNGAYVTPTMTVRFGLVGMGVAPAGLDKAKTGHHHLVVDAPLPPFDKPIPNDFNHLHFGLGQTEAQVTLTPGAHTLQLLLGDSEHIPHDPPVFSAPIKVFVTPTGRPPYTPSHYYYHHRRHLYSKHS